MESYTQELGGGAIEPSPDAMLDATDRAILNLIQSSFPIKSRPYLAIGKVVGITENEAFQGAQSEREKKHPPPGG